jgi:hypothetical protein
MSCKKIWTREFVMEKFDGKWVRNTFMPHIGLLLVEQEKMLLPSTQSEANLVRQIKNISAEIKELPTNIVITRKYKSKPDELELQLQSKRELRNTLLNNLNDLKDKTITYGGITKKKEEKQVLYILKCPCDECRGFVDENYMCGTCNKMICNNCHFEKTEKHKCKKEDILSARCIQNDTKPCPKCKTPIWKISGCDQMFCTQCKTSFSWQTGKIETGILHNPHLYEWLAGGGLENINIEEIACGEVPNLQLYIYKLRAFMDQDQRRSNKLIEMYRILNHCRDSINFYSVDRIKDNFDLRVQYLLNEFDEKIWCMKLVNREKSKQKIRSIRELLELYITILSDLTRQVVYTQKYELIIAQYDKLVNYHDECINRIIMIHGGTIKMDIHYMFKHVEV